MKKERFINEKMLHKLPNIFSKKLEKFSKKYVGQRLGTSRGWGILHLIYLFFLMPSQKFI